MENQWLYDGVASFENPDFETPDSLFHNNPYGVSVYTDWMADYGAVRHPDSQSIVNAGGEVMPRPLFPTLDSGMQVGQSIIDNQWELSGGDYLTFVKNYVYGNGKEWDDITPDEQQKLRNYAGHLETYRNHENQKSELQGVVKNIDNTVETAFYKDALFEIFPDDTAFINKNMESGEMTLDELLYQLEKQVKNQPNKLDDEVFTLNNLGIMKDSFDLGVGGMVSDLGGMFEWWGLEDVGGVVKDWGDWIQEGNETDFGKDYVFDYSHLGNKEFWMVDAPRALPSMLSLMIPYFGFGRVGASIYKGTKYAKKFADLEKAYYGTKTGAEALKKYKKGEAIAQSITGAMGGRQAESLIEAGGVWNHMKEQGYTDEQAGIAGWEVYKQNQKLMLSDATQLYGIYGRLPFRVANHFGKWVRGSGIALGMIGEGYEEVLQGYFQELGQAVADDKIDNPELILDIRKLDPEMKKAFAIGVIGGGMFEGFGALLTKDSSPEAVDRYLDDVYIKYESRAEAKENAKIDMDGEFNAFLQEATGLEILKDKLRIAFSDRTLRDVYTAEELISIGYNPKDFEGAKLDETSPRYDTEVGGDQFLLEPEAFNYVDGDGVVNVIFGENATQEAVLEDVVEAVYRRLEELDPVLYNDIKAWEQRNQEKSRSFTGRELFSKSFVYNYLGIESVNPDNNTGTVALDPDIAERVDALFVNQDGTNIITELMGIQERRTDRLPQDEVLALPEASEVQEDETVEPMVVRSKPRVVIKEQGSTKEGNAEVGDYVQWTSQGVDQFQNPKQVVAIEQDGEGRLWAMLANEKSGVPLDELEIMQPPATTDNVWVTIDGSQGELFTVPELDPDVREEDAPAKPVVKRTVTIKGLGEQLTLEDAVNAVNEQDKDINNIKKNQDSLNNLKKEDMTYSRILNILSQHPETASALEGAVSMSVVREITKNLNIPVRGRKKIDHLTAIQEFFEDAKGKDSATEGAYIGTWLPSKSVREVHIPSVRQNLTNIILDAYKRLLPDGTFVVHLPEGTSAKSRERIKTMLMGTDADRFKVPRRGMVKIGKEKISKGHSGLFGQKNYKESLSTPTKLVFHGKAQVPPSLVNFMSVNPTLEGLGGKGRGLRRQWNKSSGDWGVDNRTYTQAEYDSYLERGVETGIGELIDERIDVFETFGRIKDTEGLRFIDIAIDWYTGAVEKSIDVMANSELPSLKDNIDNQNLWRVLLGLTSPNQAVDNNFNYATEIYKHIDQKGQPRFENFDKKHKSFVTLDGVKVKMPNAIANNIEMFYEMQNLLGGMQETIDFLSTKQKPETVDKLLEQMNRKPYGTTTNKGFQAIDLVEGVYGAEIFGFKVGAFVANLLGAEDVSTIDLWMSRQMNRWLGEPYTRTNKDVGRMFGDNYFAPNSKVTKMRDEAGARQNFLLFRDIIKGISNDKRITESFGRKLKPMEVQALLWYMEKALYLNQNARSQKELKESDYGSYAEIRQEKRRDPSFGLEVIEEAESKQSQGAYIRGSGKTAFESTSSETSEGANLGKIDLNEDTEKEVRPFVKFNAPQTKESKKKEKEHNKLYAPRNWRDYLVTFSTQIGKIHSAFPALFRRFQFFSLKYYNEAMAEVEPLITGLKDLHKQASKKNATQELRDDYLDIDMGLKNQNYKEIKPLLEKYGLWDSVVQARATLDRLARDKEAVGFDSGFLEDYFPRVVTDHLMLRDYLLQYVATEGDKQAIAEEIEARSEEINRVLTNEEMVEVMQRVLLGRAVTGTGKPDNFKIRKITRINSSANQYYAPTHDALGIYMAQVTEAIATKRFLGSSKYTVRKQGSQFIVADKRTGRDATGLKFKNKADAFAHMKGIVKEELDMQGIPLMGMQHTIDSFILKALTEYGLSKEYEPRLRRLLQSYFMRDKGNPMVMSLKSAGYITSMGSVFSAITQIADIGLAVWRSGDRGLMRIPTGSYRTIKALTESLVYSFGQRRFNDAFVGREEYGVDAIAEELKPTGQKSFSNSLLNILQKVFKVVQLERLDQVGKDTTVNATLAKFRSLAKNPTKKEYSEFIWRLQQSFSAEEVAQILKDLQDGTKSELVLLLSYTELLKVQPIGKSEVPVGYLDMPNGRILYQLKTFFLKRFDVYRDELKYINSEYAKAEEAGEKGRMKGLKAMYHARWIALMSLFVLAEMGTDEIKDLIAGRETDLSDKALQNLLKMVGLSKFTFWTARREGLDSALLKMVMPPFMGVANDIIIKDIYTVGEKYAKDGNKGVAKHMRESGLRVYNHIPVLGKHLYWWNEDLFGKRPSQYGIGRGVVINEKYGSGKDKKKRKKRTRRKRRRDK